MSQYSINISKCLANWGKKSQECNGDRHCLEEHAKELRECMDAVFPPSTRTEFESDKTNYMMSTVFFLSNRLAKALIGLSEYDEAMEEFENIGKDSSQDNDDYKIIYENKKSEIDKILAKYF
ncbi:MAG TPA: hypothetical protein VN703_09565 [Candidatus Sulfopaludibacter sp.]|nr:hypothetical protein [Candidatus Sulfopaludibacter sp.]